MLPLIGAVAGAGLSLLGNSIQNKQNKKITRSNRQHEIEMWNMQNAYNTPLKQRQRLEAAGLNPNLMYGHGSVANTASQVNTSKNPDAAPVKFDTASDLAAYQNIAMFDEQRQNMAKNREVMDSQIALNNIRGASEAVKTSRNKFDLKQAESLFDTTLQGAELNVRGKQLKNIQNEIFNSQMSEKHKQAMYESAVRILQMKQSSSTSAVDEQLKKEELKLRKVGINPNDSTWLRVLTQFFLSESNPDNPNSWMSILNLIRK
jgi:hypothetical protein